jgi:glyoxylase-like metal-dependent hydrolase (beta-lactamase superfamily II)
VHVPSFLREAYDLENALEMVRKIYAGRAVFHDGESEVVPGLTLHRVGGHTAGLQIVRVWTNRGWMVLAADAAHLYSNFEQDRAFPVVYSVAEMLEGYKTAVPPGRFAESHRAGARSAGDEVLSGLASGPRRHRRAAGCSAVALRSISNRA